ncbi:PREDICTED: uncharacterized protein LOC109239792 [Nicotiana attenuata]|uniref:uncharacterized protein LOC109239792 n=1 Tax=Nicotiana attenuata TaxID=49451 RepID=UPI0009054BC6|nr:PREDICTED: uncharacterized protein LOC109239792 [Nicotiana attenuata]
MECISTITYSLTLNGGLTKPFRGQRGIRQGDPISPYLFVLAIEYLQREFAQLAADLPFIRLLQQAFMKFSMASSLQANTEKSSIYLSAISASLKQDILEELGFTEGTIPFRLQLIKSVIFGVQSYWAQLFLLPKKVLKMIEAICISFLWKGTSSISKKALVSCEKICMPQAAGGLNIVDSVSIPKNAAWFVRKILGLRSLITELQNVQADLPSRLAQLLTPGGSFSIKKLFKFNLWLVANGRLPTVDRLQKIGIQVA